MIARDIMTENPACCTASASIRDAARMMRDNNCGLIPVVDNLQKRTLLGVITDRDIVCRTVASENLDCTTVTVQQAMTSGKLWTGYPDSSIDDVIEAMEEGQVRRIVVVNNDNQVEGIIAMADLALELDEEEDIAEVLEEISEPTNIPHA